MRQKAVIFLVLVWVLSIGATPLDFESAGYQKMYATAYILQGTTASGGTTRPGICACNPHLGDVAIVYTTDGDYLGMYECTDTGGTNGLKNGTVIDIWRANMTQAENFMRLTGGQVYVKWIEGDG